MVDIDGDSSAEILFEHNDAGPVEFLLYSLGEDRMEQVFRDARYGCD